MLITVQMLVRWAVLQCRRYEDDQEEAMEEAYQEYLFRQGQRQKAAELKAAKEAKPGDLFKQPAEEVSIVTAVLISR